VAPEFCCPVRCDDLTIGYEHIRSRGAHGITVNNVYERLVEADREIWLGKDGSGLIKTTPIRWSFFLDEQRARWEAAGHPANVESSQPSYFPFGPGGLSNSHARLSKLPTDPGELAASLEATRRLSLSASPI
jgi:hypothetical protein